MSEEQLRLGANVITDSRSPPPILRDQRNSWVLDGELVIATVICEDLARVEPAKEVLRSVAPNFTFAILMDGAQHEHRWASRYAMGLSDDPSMSRTSGR